MPVPSKSRRGLPHGLCCWLTVSALASAGVVSDGSRGSVVSHAGSDYGLTGGTKVMRLGAAASSFLLVGRGSVEDSPDEPQTEFTTRVRQKGKGKVRLR